MNDWRDSARCLGTDPEAFFPSEKGSHAPPIVKRLCLGCPVRAECLEAALAVDEAHDYGYWGGTSRVQRRRIRKAREIRRLARVVADERRAS